MKMSTTELMTRGMDCLVENLGIIEAEYFISAIIREQFDYTKWRRKYFDRFSPEKIDDEAYKYAKEHPYTGNGNII